MACPSLINNSQLVVVPKDSPIKTLEDLKGKIVAVQDDSTGSYLLEQPAHKELAASMKEVRKYPDFAAIYMEIDNKRVDAAIVDAVLARGYYDKKKPGAYRILEQTMGDEVVAIAFRKDDKDFKDRIDKAMDEMKKDGTCKKISEKWMGADLAAAHIIIIWREIIYGLRFKYHPSDDGWLPGIISSFYYHHRTEHSVGHSAQPRPCFRH